MFLPREALIQVSIMLNASFLLFLQIDRVIFCVFLETDYEIYKRKMSDFFSPGTVSSYWSFYFILFVGCNTHSARSLLPGYQAGFTVPGRLTGVTVCSRSTQIQHSRIGLDST